VRQLLGHRYKQFFTTEVIHAMLCILLMCNVAMSGFRRGLLWTVADAAVIPAVLATLDWIFSRHARREAGRPDNLSA